MHCVAKIREKVCLTRQVTVICAEKTITLMKRHDYDSHSHSSCFTGTNLIKSEHNEAE